MLPLKYTELHAQLYGQQAPSTMCVGRSDANIISPSRGFMEGFDFTMQLMIGCPAGCQFCYVRTAPRLAPTSVRGQSGTEWGYHILRKHDADGKFSKHLLSGKLAHKTIYWSGVTDPYASEPLLTHGIWEALASAPASLRPKRIVVQTRYPADRDAEIMARYTAGTALEDGGPPVVISFSIGTDRDDLIREWERATPLFEQRIRAAERLTSNGLFVVATLSPMALWNDLPGTMMRLKSIGVQYVTILFFKERTSSANTPPRFLDYLRREYPQLLDPQWQEARQREVEQVWEKSRVLVAKAGFASLAAPHLVAGTDLLASGNTR